MDILNTARRASYADALAKAKALLLQDPSSALEEARSALAAAPEDPAARLIRGAALRRMGRAAEAVGALSPLAEAQPGAWGPQFEVGAALLQSGDIAAAIGRLTLALALNPKALLARWALAEAEDRDRHVVLNDDGARAAVGALLDGQPDADRRLARLGLSLADPLALQLVLGLALVMGRDAQAVRLLPSRPEAFGDYAPLRRTAATVLMRQQRASQALAILGDGIDGDAERLMLRGAALTQLGRHEAAEADYRRLLEIAPDRARSWLSYGHLLKTVGRRQEAIDAYRRCLALAPGMGEAYWSLANLKVVRFQDADLEAMRGRLAGAALDSEDEACLRFALGKALDEAGQFAEAFAEYDRGAALARVSRPHDPDAQTRFIERSRRVFTRALLAERGAGGDPATDPIFIVGLPRSGSTLVEQILASHPWVEGTSELPELTLLAGELADPIDYPEGLARLAPEALRAAGRAYLERARAYRRLDRPRFTDKAPGNALHVGLILLALPNARIIDIRRDPMSCCFSAFTQHFARGQNYSYDLTWLGRYHRDYEALMAHFDEVAPGRIHHLNYEDLVAEPEAEIRRLLAYCDLPFDNGCLRFYETARPVRTASSEQVRRPINREGLDRWRPYAPWLEPLARALGAAPSPL